jgi:hypothetical protein
MVDSGQTPIPENGTRKGMMIIWIKSIETTLIAFATPETVLLRDTRLAEKIRDMMREVLIRAQAIPLTRNLN